MDSQYIAAYHLRDLAPAGQYGGIRVLSLPVDLAETEIVTGRIPRSVPEETARTASEQWYNGVANMIHDMLVDARFDGLSLNLLVDEYVRI